MMTKKTLSESEARKKLALLKRLKSLEEKSWNIKRQLPHLYGQTFYRWQRTFFESVNSMNLLCAANQIGKSAASIRKCIHWATATNLWKKLWPGQTPRIFWYIYPNSEVATIEFEKKWVPEFMPRGHAKDHAVYGWSEKRDKGYIKQIDFKSGVSIVFKTHSQALSALQTATVHAVFADEELPEDMYSEISIRLAATEGYFHMVFTATLNQELWRRAIQSGTREEEMFPAAHKVQISMYDCLVYEDGSPGLYTEEKIKKIMAQCKSQAEIDRRVFGKFVTEQGRTFHAFDIGKHFSEPMQVPPMGWGVYAGVDPGGGGTSHPSAIICLAVDPPAKKGVVFRAWRGDGIQTTAGDVYEKYRELSRDLHVVDKRYDYSAKDFETIASRAGESFNKADKNRERGEEILNTLFRNGMLTIADGDVELRKLGTELATLLKGADKAKSKDDLADALRYAVMAVGWDFEELNRTPAKESEVEYKPKRMTEAELLAEEIKERRRGFFDEREEKGFEEASWADDDFDEWNNAY